MALSWINEMGGSRRGISYMSLNTLQREQLIKLFVDRVVKKVTASSEFSADEKEAARYASSVLSKLGGSLRAGGRARDKKPSKVALSFRLRRAKKAVEAAREAGIGGRKLGDLNRVVEEAQAEYDKFVKREKRAAKKVGTA